MVRIGAALDGAAMTGRPRIGVTASARGGRLTWWFIRTALWRAGAMAVRLVPDDGNDDRFSRLDGLVIGGGDDIEPHRYGLALEPAVRLDPDRDELELAALDRAAAKAWPVLGICRGAQMLNVHRGGTLHTDIHAVYVAAPRLRTVLPRKRVRITPGTRLDGILACRGCRVNALHHQSVDRLGTGLRIAAADEHGIVQAIEDPDHPFLLGVQWHPEFLIGDSGQQGLFRALTAAAGVG